MSRRVEFLAVVASPITRQLGFSLVSLAAGRGFRFFRLTPADRISSNAQVVMACIPSHLWAPRSGQPPGRGFDLTLPQISRLDSERDGMITRCHFWPPVA